MERGEEMLPVFRLLFWFILSFAPARATQHGIPLGVVKLWASAFGGEIKSISAKYSGSQLLQKKYKDQEKSVRLEEVDGAKIVKAVAENIEEIFRRKAEATRRLVEAAEEAHLQHEENPDLQVYKCGSGKPGVVEKAIRVHSHGNLHYSKRW